MIRTAICLLLLLVSGNVFAAGKDLPYEVNGEAFSGYLFTPEKASQGFLLLIHDWDGLTGYEKKRAAMLGALGYTVFAADLYGTGIRPTETAEKRKMTGALYSNRDRMRALLQGALLTAQKENINTTSGVAMGYCFGGAVVLELARSGEKMKGFVSFHGGLTTPESQDYTQTQGQILILHGTADAAVSMDDFASLAEELEDADIPHEMVTYAGAPHAFTVFGSPRYREDADKKSWRRFTSFLGEVFE